MYNPLLDTFLTVCEEGSFNKAAARLYLSPTAVMKQINSLESLIGFRLFNRSAAGLSLTQSGEQFYKDSVFVKDYSDKAILSARMKEEESEKTFCVGTSLLNPAKPFMDLWYTHNKAFQDYRLHLVPFEDDQTNILHEIDALGVKYDFLIGVCDSRMWLERCQFLQLGTYKKMVAVRRDHPLAKYGKLKLSDLAGYTLRMVSSGDSPANDAIRKDLKKKCPDIHIEDTGHFFDLSVFSHCAESDEVLLTVECWKDVHPSLVTIPVEWNYTIPYGILYPLHAGSDIEAFIREIREPSSV